MSQRSEGHVGWGLVGTGRHADQYVAPAIQSATGAYLAAVCGTDTTRTEAFAHRHGVAAAYTSLERMLDDASVTHVFVCSPNDLHEEHVRLCAQRGRAVLCEKPLAHTPESAARMVEVCRSHGIPLGVGYHLRHNRAHVRAREAIAAGAVGEVLSVEVQYVHRTGTAPAAPLPAWRRDPGRVGGGQFAGTGTHAADLAGWLVADTLASVYATQYRHATDDGGEHIVQTVVGRLAGGVLVSLSAGRMPHALNAVTVTGTKGVVRLTGSVGNRGGGRMEILRPDSTTTVEVVEHDVYREQIEAFERAVRLGYRPSADGVDGLNGVNVAVAVERSLQNGAEVVVGELATAGKE